MAWEYAIWGLSAVSFALLYKELRKTTKSNPRIGIELVPLGMSGYNVRSRVDADAWKSICKTTHRKNARNGLLCQVCKQSGQSQGFRHPVECHEIWEFYPETGIQKLTGLMTLCPMCHKAKHFGLAKRQGFETRVRKHMKKVNGWGDNQLNTHIAEATKLVKERNKIDWKLDLTFLNNPNFKLGRHFTEDEKRNCNSPFEF